jgi:hypothetical protein
VVRTEERRALARPPKALELVVLTEHADGRVVFHLLSTPSSSCTMSPSTMVKTLRVTGRSNPTNHASSWSVYFVDPEGNRIEFFTQTPWYMPPVSVPLDLGLSDEEIHKHTEAMVKATRDTCFWPSGTSRCGVGWLKHSDHC